MNGTTIAETLDAVYESATAPERWPDALGRLGQAFGCTCVSLVNKNRRTSEGSAAAWGVDDASQREYLDVWLSRNVLHMHTRVWRQGEVETDQDVLPKHEFLRSDYYNCFLRPRDMYAMLRVATHVDAETLQTLALARPKSAGDYEPSDVEELRPLIRHVQRAAMISRHLNETRDTLRGMSATLEQSSTGVVLLSRRGDVIFANALVTSIAAAGTGLRLRSGRLSATNPGEDAVLQRLIAGAVGSLVGIEDERGGAIRISAGAGKRTYTLVIGPLEGRTAINNTSPAAFVLLTDPDRGLTRPAWMLRSLYGLSAAEASLAERLMSGDSPEQAAVALNIKISTARWHLSSLFRKTDTRRQAELMRLLLSLPRI